MNSTMFCLRNKENFSRQFLYSVHSCVNVVSGLAVWQLGSKFGAVRAWLREIVSYMDTNWEIICPKDQIMALPKFKKWRLSVSDHVTVYFEKLNGSSEFKLMALPNFRNRASEFKIMASLPNFRDTSPEFQNISSLITTLSSRVEATDG